MNQSKRSGRTDEIMKPTRTINAIEVYISVRIVWRGEVWSGCLEWLRGDISLVRRVDV